MSQLRVHILWNFVYGPHGGANQFLRTLKEELSSRGAYADDPLDADGILFTSFPSDPSLFKRAWDLKRQNPSAPLVHRLDGPISITRGTKEQTLDRGVYEFANLFSDGCIFQSHWCLDENMKLGFDAASLPVAVVINAPSAHLFNTKNKLPFRYEKPRIIATSWSSNLRKGFDDYRWIDENLDFSRYAMSFVGRSPYVFQNIKMVGPVDKADMAARLKDHDIYIGASRYEACSNSILEAIHCGLPALCYNGSGNPETLQGCGLLYERPEEIPGALEILCQDFPSIQQKMAPIPLTTVADQYLEFFEAILTTGAAPKLPTQQALDDFLVRYTPAQTGIRAVRRRIKARFTKIVESLR